MSGGLYVTLYVLCMIATGGLVALGSSPRTTEAIPFIPMPMVVLGIVMMVFIYKMWNAINDGHTKPTPGAALGLLFVPFFSIYWVFVVYPGWATRYTHTSSATASKRRRSGRRSSSWRSSPGGFRSSG